MLTASFPSATELTHLIVGLSGTYTSLYNDHRDAGETIRPAFREPADEALHMYEESVIFTPQLSTGDFDWSHEDTPDIDLSESGQFQLSLPVIVARHIVERSNHEGYRHHWKERLYKSGGFQVSLWHHLEAAAEGFLRAGYRTYEPEPTSHAWVLQVMEKSLALVCFQQDKAFHFKILEPAMAYLQQLFEMEDYPQIAATMENISHSATLQESEDYFRMLLEMYQKIPYHQPIRQLIADHLDNSERPEARALFQAEHQRLLDKWHQLGPLEKMKHWRLRREISELKQRYETWL